jgi:hypothetical protein
MPARGSWFQGWKALAFAALMIPGCSIDRGTLTAIATHNVAVPSQPVARDVEGSDCVYFAFGMPVSGSLAPDLREAVDNALAEAPEGDALENVVIYRDTAPFSVCLRVKGDVVRIAGPTQTSLSTTQVIK